MARGRRVSHDARVIPPDDVKRRIEAALPGAQIEVHDLTGTEDHYRVHVRSERFDGMPSLQRHRLVHAALKDVLGGPLHAIELITRANGES